MPIAWENVGAVHISVYEDANGENLFYINADNEHLLPVLDYIEKTLYEY